MWGSKQTFSNVQIVTMKLIVSNSLVNIVNCFRVISYLDYAKDTLVKEIMNDKHIVSVMLLILRLLLAMYLYRTKLSLLLPKMK